MKIELKNIKFYERMSEETNAFIADLFIDGKKVGFAKNEGHGGCTGYHPNSLEDREAINAAEKYCLTLPPITYQDINIEMNLENKIDELFEEWLKAKEEAKLKNRLAKDMLVALCVKTPAGYEMLTWKSGQSGKPVPIAQMVSVENGKNLLRNKIIELIGKERIILNTNVPQELYN